MKAMFLKICKSFANAFRGFWGAAKTERNLRIHLVVSCFVFWLSAICKISRAELLFVAAAVMAVVSAELFNTALEKLCDLYNQSFDERIRLIKDVSAAAVLASAVIAAVGGLVIFANGERIFVAAAYFNNIVQLAILAAAIGLSLVFIFFFGRIHTSKPGNRAETDG